METKTVYFKSTWIAEDDDNSIWVYQSVPKKFKFDDVEWTGIPVCEIGISGVEFLTNKHYNELDLKNTPCEIQFVIQN